MIRSAVFTPSIWKTGTNWGAKAARPNRPASSTGASRRVRLLIVLEKCNGPGLVALARLSGQGKLAFVRRGA